MKYLPTRIWRAWLLSVALLGFGCAGTPEVKEPVRPNFLFLFADDQAFDALHAMGNPDIHTPHLDRLAARGMTFTHCFNQGSWSGAVCVVSRAMLNSGLYIYHARERFHEVPLWGETLGEAGYATFLTGKWHNGAPAVLRSFETARSVGKGMFETKGGPAGPGYRRPTPENNAWAPADTSLTGHWRPELWDLVATDTGKVQGPFYTETRHTSELYADRAIDFLEARGDTAQRPFFMYVAFNAPHDPRQAPQAFVDRYPPDSLPLPESYLPEHPFDQGQRYTLRDEILAPFPRTPQAVKTHIGEYYAIISHMDAQIGRILDALEASGEADRTYIIFSADHGLAVGRHGLMGKQNPYDHSIRMPFMVVGPDIEPGKKSDALIYLQSLYPTTCEWAGIPVPSHVEFSSLLPLISGEAESQHPAIFGSYLDFQRLIRTPSHKLVIYPKVEQVQLFDLVQDPYELNNLAGEPGQKARIGEMYGQLLQLQQSVGDTLDLRHLPFMEAYLGE